ncbi:MAG: hypothetical protein SO046_03310 [Actinomyces urogenitalis]|uniref:hypothetical protein n=1 Tax=Actinomyces urogenitalis TaxID=103621 RepID=UPI002A809C6D|nr:hypothetical protein [Actinomyces urogenitalis]MDY3678232.1 hypothetical protein [Actinomyces urogenitalis]
MSDANRFIGALNRIAEGVTMLAAAIEETEWEGFEDHAGMPGARPIAAAGLAQPDLEQAAAEYEAARRQAPEPAHLSRSRCRWRRCVECSPGSPAKA